jgi:hypothetical protein
LTGASGQISLSKPTALKPIFPETPAMRLAAGFIVVVAFSAIARADHGIPTNQTLAEMGLAHLEVFSDADALPIRGSGFKIADKLSGLAHYEQSKLEFRQRVRAFQNRIDLDVFKSAASLRKRKAGFQANVNKFRAKIN